VLGERALAVTADSESLSGEQRQLALEVAQGFGFRHRLVRTHELANPLYARNHADRCYHCKSELFARLAPLAAAEGYAHVAYGLIVDDLQDFRRDSGRRPRREPAPRSPRPASTKQEVRALSRDLGLPTAELPASPCLASRLPYGTPVTLEPCGAWSGRKRVCARWASMSCASGTWARARAWSWRPPRWRGFGRLGRVRPFWLRCFGRATRRP